MPLDRRKQPPLAVGTLHIVVSDQDDQRCDGDRRMLTLRDVEEAYQQRIQQHRKRQPPPQTRRRKGHRNPSRYYRVCCSGHNLRTVVGAVPLLLLSMVLLMVMIVLLFGKSTAPLWFPWNDHESKGGEISVERTMLQAPQLDNRGIPSRSGSASTNSTTASHPTTYDRSPMIAWLMSFPNSGTSYTIRLVREVSQTPTASNYADETPEGAQGRKRAVFPDQPTGPFWILNDNDAATEDNTKSSNQTFVLTKTHCGIRCNPCSPEEMAETTYSFRRRCLVTKWVNTATGANKYSTYPADRVRKAVHLFRDPFDNVVSRFHLVNQQTGHPYPTDKLGFLQYCRSIDYQYTESETRYMHFAENKLLAALWKVPCHADFLRYVEWHNLAIVVQNDLQLDTFRLHYEDFGSEVDKFPATLNALLEFLELPARATPTTPFVPDKSYRLYFSQSETRIIRDALHFASSRQTWDQIGSYFGEAAVAVV